MSLVKIFKLTVSVLFMTLFIISCDKGDDEGLMEMDYTETSTNAISTLASDLSSNRSNPDKNSDTLDCFVFNYPVTVIFPDNTELTVNDDDALEAALDQWYDSNPMAENYPTFAFPIEITLTGGMVETVSDEDQLEKLIDNCFDYEDSEYFEDYEGEIEDLCFDITYPITVLYPDGTSQSVDSDSSFENAIDQWYMANGEESGEPAVEFPISVTLEDGTTLDVNSEKEIEDLIDGCDFYTEDEDEEYEDEEDYDDEDEDEENEDYDDEDEDEDEEEYPYDDHYECFNITYPVSVTLPDNTTAEATDEDSLEDIYEQWYESNPESNEDPTLQYPITITITDGTSQTINNDAELDAAFESCGD